MEYRKPRITLLGAGITEIHGVGKVPYPVPEFTTCRKMTVPAYEGDE